MIGEGIPMQSDFVKCYWHACFLLHRGMNMLIFPIVSTLIYLPHPFFASTLAKLGSQEGLKDPPTTNNKHWEITPSNLPKTCLESMQSNCFSCNTKGSSTKGFLQEFVRLVIRHLHDWPGNHGWLRLLRGHTRGNLITIIHICEQSFQPGKRPLKKRNGFGWGGKCVWNSYLKGCRDNANCQHYSPPSYIAWANVAKSCSVWSIRQSNYISNEDPSAYKHLQTMARI